MIEIIPNKIWIEIEQAPCGFYHGVIHHADSGGEVLVSEAHWPSEEEARVGLQATVDQALATLEKKGGDAR